MEDGSTDRNKEAVRQGRLSRNDVVDVVLIGGGIMSATLGAILKEAEPRFRIRAFERLDAVALESSAGINNAGTGHAGNCELNYTSRTTNGGIDISRACLINEKFEHSLQLWASMVENGWVGDPSKIINSTPHMSFVWGEDDAAFLEARWRAMAAHPFFDGMAFSQDPSLIKEWAPLIIEGRGPTVPIAAARISRGTDVNFGNITHALFEHLEGLEDFELEVGMEVKQLKRLKDRTWLVKAERRDTGAVEAVRARFVFIGAGGRALPLLIRSGIPEARGYGGFPVSGMWLWCKNREVVERHAAKVYGKAKLGAPPMSVPHLDTRVLQGKKQLLFGPFAGFSTKFLKNGSYLDLFRSLRPGNILPIIAAGLTNLSLTAYLVGQVLQSQAARRRELREYFPDARDEDWELRVAGQRVQIIKRTKDALGKIEFGTEIVVSKDGSLAALLGASPGASTSAAVVLDLIEICFAEEMKSKKWQSALLRLIPSFGVSSLGDAPESLTKLRARSDAILKIGNASVQHHPSNASPV
jgi:malate dehydrogenase (quinone)